MFEGNVYDPLYMDRVKSNNIELGTRKKVVYSIKKIRNNRDVGMENP